MGHCASTHPKLYTMTTAGSSRKAYRSGPIRTALITGFTVRSTALRLFKCNTATDKRKLTFDVALQRMITNLPAVPLMCDLVE